jgi:hypothetical protein
MPKSKLQTNSKIQTMANDKAQMSNQAESPDNKTKQVWHLGILI